MKHVIYLYILALLFSCAQKPQEITSSLPNKSAQEKPVNMEKSFVYPEIQVVASLMQKIQSNEGISSHTAENCWSNEQSRPSVQTYCVLAWAKGKNSSDKMEKIVLERAPFKMMFSMAAIYRENILKQFTKANLLLLLKNIDTAPDWLKIKTIRVWSENRIPLDIETSIQLFKTIEPHISSNPFSQRESALFLKQHLFGQFQELLAKNCNINSARVTRIRCWRFLSSISKEGEITFSDEIKRFRPEKNDSDWHTFEMSYPNLAISLNTFYSK